MPKAPVRARPAPPNGVAQREAVVAAFVQLVNRVPDEPAGDVTDLLGPILAATTWDGLNTTDKLPSSKTLVGRELRLEQIGKKVTDKQSLTGYYLFARGVDLETGEPIRWTAGGGQAVAVMSQLHVLRELPAKIRYNAVDLDDGNQAVNCQVLDV